MRSVINAALKVARKSARHAPSGFTPDESWWEGLASEAEPVEQQIENSEFQRQLWESMQKLSPRQRLAIVQRYYLDMSEKEIAEELEAAPERSNGYCMPPARTCEPCFRKGSKNERRKHPKNLGSHCQGKYPG